MIIKLPFPSAELFPNRKNGKHWTATRKAKALQFEAAYFAAKAAGPFKDAGGYIPISLMFLTPDRRHRDADNMLAAAKHLLDGVASAIGVDDSRFKPIHIDWEHGMDKAGALIVGVGVEVKSFTGVPV